MYQLQLAASHEDLAHLNYRHLIMRHLRLLTFLRFYWKILGAAVCSVYRFTVSNSSNLNPFGSILLITATCNRLAIRSREEL